MPNNIFSRLRKYYLDVARVLKDGSGAASIFPNKPDIGGSREKIYAEFLRQHVPSKCNVFLGGFVFAESGEESNQIDIIITTDTTPCFNFFNNNNEGKSFSPVEGTLSIISIKSTLTKDALFDALHNIASIPSTKPLDNRVIKSVRIQDYDNWPLKVIYASDGLEAQTIIKHLDSFYAKNSNIPLNRRPDVIHVAEKYFIVRGRDGMMHYDNTTISVSALNPGEFHVYLEDPDLQAILFIINELQKITSASAFIIFSYDYLNQKISTSND